jgi:hypothetical protein
MVIIMIIPVWPPAADIPYTRLTAETTCKHQYKNGAPEALPTAWLRLAVDFHALRVKEKILLTNDNCSVILAA